MAPASDSLTSGFYAVVIIAVLAALAIIRQSSSKGSANAGRILGASIFGPGAWMALTWMLASSGKLQNFDTTPPPIILLIGLGAVGTIVLAFSKFGATIANNTALWVLVGFNAFRFPLEMVMHKAFEDGVMPEQMSYSGNNSDILTGISAIVVALLIKQGIAGTKLARMWNLMGAALLLNVITVAIRSLPIIAHWGPDQVNTWVADAPFIWLPCVLVAFALFSHIVIARKLTSRAQ